MELHPDKGGSVEAMQELNTEFEIAFALAQKLNPATEKESSSSYRKAFYTANGWKGSRYDRNLTAKAIAKLSANTSKTCIRHTVFQFPPTLSVFKSR